MDHFAAQYRRLRSLFAAFLPSEIVAALMPLAKPALRLGARGGVPVRLGGPPLLPPGEPWPRWNGRPLDFLGAIDFTDLTRFGDIPGLPTSGKAAFYYASENPVRGVTRPNSATAGASSPATSAPQLHPRAP